MPTYVNEWDNFGGTDESWACTETEYCQTCGLLMVESIEPTGRRLSKTGEPSYHRYHSCPSWLTGWRTSRWARGWACPGDGHDSHDADNPLSMRDRFNAT